MDVSSIFNTIKRAAYIVLHTAYLLETHTSVVFAVHNEGKISRRGRKGNARIILTVWQPCARLKDFPNTLDFYLTHPHETTLTRDKAREKPSERDRGEGGLSELICHCSLGLNGGVLRFKDAGPVEHYAPFYGIKLCLMELRVEVSRGLKFL